MRDFITVFILVCTIGLPAAAERTSAFPPVIRTSQAGSRYSEIKKCKQELAAMGCNQFAGNPDLRNCSEEPSLVSDAAGFGLGTLKCGYGVFISPIAEGATNQTFHNTVFEGHRLKFLDKCQADRTCIANLYREAYGRDATEQETDTYSESWKISNRMDHLWQIAASKNRDGIRSSWFNDQVERLRKASGWKNMAAKVPINFSTVKKILEDNYNKYPCLNVAGRTELACYVASAVATGGAALATVTRLPRFAALARVAGKKPNPQIEAWNKMTVNPAEGAAMEESLRKALADGNVASSRKIGEGASKPDFVKLDSGVEAVWKNGQGARPNKEVAAYVVDRELGFNIVPTTVKRTIDGAEGSMQVRINDLSKLKRSGEIPEDIRLFDALINHGDRHSNLNWLRTKDGRVAAIDHSDLSFFSGGTNVPSLLENINYLSAEATAMRAKVPTIKDPVERAQFVKALESWEYSLKHSLHSKQRYEDMLRSRPDVMERLAQTPPTRWREILQPHLSPQELESFLGRRLELLEYYRRVQTDGHL